jgi:hypothetical protein
LFKAVAAGQLTCAELLLPVTSKNLVDQANVDGDTPLAVATWKGHSEMQKVLRAAEAKDTPNILFCRAFQFAMLKRYGEAITILEELSAKDKLAVKEPAWHMEFDGWRYEIPLPYVTVHAVLADCYERTGQAEQKQKAIKACEAVWLKDAPQLDLYARTRKTGEVLQTFKAWLSRSEIDKQLENTSQLPLRLQVGFRYEMTQDQGRPPLSDQGTKEGVTH